MGYLSVQERNRVWAALSTANARMPRLTLLGATAAALVALAGCGGGDGTPADPSPTTPAASSSAPAGAATCEDLIGVGKPVLQHTIDNGCDMADGSVSAFTSHGCGNGPEVHVFNDEFYGVVGGTWKAGDTQASKAGC